MLAFSQKHQAENNNQSVSRKFVISSACVFASDISTSNIRRLSSELFIISACVFSQLGDKCDKH